MGDLLVTGSALVAVRDAVMLEVGVNVEEGWGFEEPKSSHIALSC